MRSELLERLGTGRFDVLVVGGGINGAVSAAALAAGGATVALVERGDFAGLTSQETSNLVWGGVKYLQSRELRLVWSLCGARNRLVAAFPGRVRPTRFLGVLDGGAPVGRRVAGAGAALYWALGRGVTPRPRSYGPRRAAAVEPLVATPGLRGAVEYWDARLVDGDARFVWDFVASALSNGAVAVNYVALVAAERSHGGSAGPAGWRVRLRDVRTGEELETTARVVVNAAGPLAPEVGELLGAPARHRLALSKGVHLVVPRILAADRVVAMFDDDSRPFFVIPLGDRTMIGTTDTRVAPGDVDAVAVTEEDRAFLLAQVNRRLALERPLTSADVVAERAGVRPLVLTGEAGETAESDWLTLSRRHRVDADTGRGVVTILGGKLTDCVNVGEEIVGVMSAFGLEVRSVNLWCRSPGLPDAAELRRLARESLPAGGFPDGRYDEYGGAELSAAMVEALWRRQGRKAPRVLAAWRADPASAGEILPGTAVSRAELDLMVREELVVTAEDLFRRRTLLGQTRSAAELEATGAVAGLFG
jgi:glycerol-3-phosphate dehydrogenase